MQRSFTYTLLITCVLLVGSCKTNYLSTSFNAQNISVSDSLNNLDSQVVQLYHPFKNIIEKDMNRVISVSEMEMIKDKPESELTNFLADLLLQEGMRFALTQGLKFEPSISYFNYGGIRTFLPEGDITVGKIFELMPFENEMVFIRLSGVQIQEFCDIIAEKGGDSVGGIQFVISNEKAINIWIGKNELNPDSDYWLVTNDYVANGGDDLQVFAQHAEFINSNLKIRELIISNLDEQYKLGKKITAKTDGRIRNE